MALAENVPTLLPDPWDRLLELMMEDDSLSVTDPATIGSPEGEKRATPWGIDRRALIGAWPRLARACFEA